MKKRMQKLFIWFLVACMCVSLGACGKKSTSSEENVEDDYNLLDNVDVDDQGASRGNGTTASDGGGSGGKSGDAGASNAYLNAIPEKLKGTTVTFAVWGDENAEEYAKVAKYFTKKTKINVKFVSYDQEKYPSTIVEQNAAGKGPDIVICNFKFPVIAEAVQELPKFFDLNDGFWDKRITEALSVKGKNYFVNSYNSPFANSGQLVFYNKEIFANNNIKSPQDYVDEGKWTYKALETCMRQAHQKGFDGGSVYPQMIWNSTGSDLIRYNPKDGKFTSGLSDPSQKSDIIYALKFSAKLFNEGIITQNPLARFASGNMAIAVTGNFGTKYNGWFKGMLPSALGVVNMPTTLNGKKANYQGGTQRAYGIGKNAKNVEGAYYFLRFFLDLDNYDDAGAKIFLNKSVERFYKETILKDYKNNPLCMQYFDMPLSLVGSPWTQTSAGDWTAVSLAGTPEEVENELNKRVNIVEKAAKTATEKLRKVS